MSHNETTIGNYIKAGDEQSAADEIIAALERSGGNLVHAALECKVHHATFKRWINKLDSSGWDVRAHLDKIRSTSVSPPPLSGSQRIELESRVKADRDETRLLVWLGKIPNDDFLEIAFSADVPVGILMLVRDQLPVGKSIREKCLKFARKKREAQLHLWREEHRARAKTPPKIKKRSSRSK